MMLRLSCTYAALPLNTKVIDKIISTISKINDVGWHLIALALNDIVDRIIVERLPQSHLNAVTFRQIFPKTAERNYSIPLIIPATHHRTVDLRQTRTTFK